MPQTRVRIELLKIGSCRHFERVSLRGGRLAPIVFPAMAALIMHPREGAMLFDTGYAQHFLHATSAFPERLYRWITPMQLPLQQTLESQVARFGLRVGDVRHCILSHFHGDHVAGLRDLPSAKIIVMRSAHQDLRSRGRLDCLLHGILPALLPDNLDARITFAESQPLRMLPPPWHSLGEGYDLLGDGSLLGVPLPGHAAGQLGLLVRDEKDRVALLSADASWSMRAVRAFELPSQITRPIMNDWKGYKQTLRGLHNLIVRHPELVILPSHCNDSLAAYQSDWTDQ